MSAILILALVAAAALAAFLFAPKGWRTVFVNGVLGLLALAGELVSYGLGFDWKTVVPAEYAPWALLALNLLNIVLRKVTTSPMGQPK